MEAVPQAVEEGLLAPGRAPRRPAWAALCPARLDDDRALGFSAITTAHIAGSAPTRWSTASASGSATSGVLSIDVDVLDPRTPRVPATPEPGGLTTRELQTIVRGLVGLDVVGADVVEVAPAYDHAELTSLAAANMAYEILGLLALPLARYRCDDRSRCVRNRAFTMRTR